MLEEGIHLPQFLKDFHAQKDVFKAMHDYYDDAKLSWVDGQIYTIDHFLHFMAIHGYTLQKSRQKFDFCCIHDTVKSYRDKVSEFTKKAFSFGKSPL